MSLGSAIARLGECQGLVVASDFDGTLAGIVDHPEEAMADQRALDCLIRLARRPVVTVAIVSGRGHRDLTSLVGEAPGLVLVGEHGNDRGEVEEATDTTVAEMEDLVAGVSHEVPGSRVEVKRQSVAFHYRTADEDAAREALRRILRWAEARPHIRTTKGKKIIELSVAPHDKGDAVLGIKEEAGAGCVVFIGDDTTDETVFAVLGPEDIGIKVGPGETAARYRVDDITEVVEVLEAIERALD